MCVSHKCKSLLPKKPRHGAQGGVLRHPPLCSVFTILFLFIFSIIFNPTSASAFNNNIYRGDINYQYLWQTTQSGFSTFNINQLAATFSTIIQVWNGDGSGNGVLYCTNNPIISINYNGYYQVIESNVTVTFALYKYDKNSHAFYNYSSADGRSLMYDNVIVYQGAFSINGVPYATPTPTMTPWQEFINGNKFGDNEESGLKGWLKDLWWFLTDPQDYGTVEVGDGDTLVYTPPTPLPTPTPYVQQQQIINPSTGEVIYNIETTIDNSASQVYPTDYVWIDDVPDSVPKQFDLNFSVSGTPTEYSTDLNFSETSDAFISTVSGVSDGVNALGSLLGAMPIEIIIYPIVAFCIWAIFAFIHRLLG